MEKMADAGDKRAIAFLAALDGERSGKVLAASARFISAIAEIDPEKVERSQRNGLDKIKRKLMAIRGEACEVCAVTMPSKTLIHAHHIVPVHNGGLDQQSNLVLLCPNCHAIAHWRYREKGIPQDSGEFFALMDALYLPVANAA